MTPREEARAAGLKQYNTGKPCPQGHIAPRFVVSCSCSECMRLHKKKVWTRRKPKRDSRVPDTFGRRVARIRARLSMTQEQLAQMIRVDPRTICYYEADSKFPHFWQLMELAKQLNVSLDYLCCRTNQRRDFKCAKN